MGIIMVKDTAGLLGLGAIDILVWIILGLGEASLCIEGQQPHPWACDNWGYFQMSPGEQTDLQEMGSFLVWSPQPGVTSPYPGRVPASLLQNLPLS